MRYLALLLLCGCMTEPNLDYVGQRPVSALVEWEAWYHETEQCLGMVGDFEAVRWYVADEILVRDGGMQAWGGVHGNEITIAVYAIRFRRTIRHESAHHITGEGETIHWGTNRARCDG